MVYQLTQLWNKTNLEQQVSTPMPPKPDNNMVFGNCLHRMLLLTIWYSWYH